MHLLPEDWFPEGKGIVMQIWSNINIRDEGGFGSHPSSELNEVNVSTGGMVYVWKKEPNATCFEVPRVSQPSVVGGGEHGG